MLNEFSSQQVVNDFLNQLLTDAGMDSVSPEVREQMLNDLKDRLEDRFVATVVSNLDENKLTTFREISEAGTDPDAVGKFINENIPNANDLFAQAMISFRQTYLGN